MLKPPRSRHCLFGRRTADHQLGEDPAAAVSARRFRLVRGLVPGPELSLGGR